MMTKTAASKRKNMRELVKAFESIFGVLLTDELYDFIKTTKKVK